MNIGILFFIATINLVVGYSLPSALGLRLSDPQQKITTLIAQSSLNEPNCTEPFTAIGSSCLHFVNELEVDHDEAEFFCDIIGGHLAVVDTATKLQHVVEYINSNYNSLQQSYWIDGARDTESQWSFENSGNEFPMGTPFWGTNENSGNCLTLSYDNSYYFTESVCNSNLPSPLCEQRGGHEGTRGTIMSPNYPHNYPSNARNEWTVTVEENDTITVNFEAFNTESSYDYLRIRDGSDSSAPELVKLTGNLDHSSISDVTSTGNALHFYFHSDSSVTKSGFKLNWSASSATEIIDVTCPPFYTAIGQDCFAFVFVPMSFNEAKITCASMNGQLGVVANAEQLRNLYLYIHDQDIADVSFWLGGSDQNDEGHFVYVDGSDVPQGTPFWGTVGSNSGTQEPDGGEEENCVALVAEGLHFLRDVKCEREFKFFCSPL